MLNRDFKGFAESLNACGVEYLVVGDYALAAHGHPRYTGDIGFWVAPALVNLERVILALQRFGFGSLGPDHCGLRAGHHHSTRPATSQN